MLNFPMPYPDELLYSTIARAGVRMGITSPKELLDEVFGDRKVVATPDISGYLRAIAEHYPAGAGLSVESLAYRHTLFPLYAPFVPESRRQQCLRLMARSTRGIVHLRLGIAASRIKQPRALRVCRGCVDEQIALYGEPYWKRVWQARGADVCPRHGRLMDTVLLRHSARRHAFVPLSRALIQALRPISPSKADVRVPLHVRELLNLSSRPSPTFDQWSRFYAALAADYGCANGKRMLHGLIMEKVLTRWPQRWLEKMGLSLTDSPTCWLRGIFHRHRKAISYLEHFVVLEAFLKRDWSAQGVLRRVARLPRERHSPSPRFSSQRQMSQEILDRRRIWQAYVEGYGTKFGRILGGGAAYSYLYRNDRAWLLRTNKRHRVNPCRNNSRVNWRQRDQDIYQRLCEIDRTQAKSLDSPRRSRRWYLAQVGCLTSMVNHVSKLPLTEAFLDLFSESVEEYQVRRIRHAMHVLNASGLPLKRWRILRASGLSEARLKKWASRFLKEVE